MALISAKCPHCGADIRVNEGSKSGVCEFCGATFVTQDAVTNYTVNNNYNTVQYITKTAASAAEAGEYIRRGDVLLSLGEFGRAEEAYLRAVELEPADWRGWFGMVKTRTKNFTDYEDTSHAALYDKAQKVAPKEASEAMSRLYEPYSNVCSYFGEQKAKSLKQVKRGNKVKTAAIVAVVVTAVLIAVCAVVMHL